MALSATVHGQDTLPKLFRHVVAERGDRVALREKDLGIWRAITWRQYGERARQVGLGLVALGLRPRDVVSVMADNCPEWLYTDLGTLCAGGVTNGIYPTDAPAQVQYLCEDSATAFLFVLSVSTPGLGAADLSATTDESETFFFTYEDFTLTGYEPHPHIKAEVAV